MMVMFTLFVGVMALWLPLSEAICPRNCTCDDEVLRVTCKNEQIDILPLTFNPALQHLTMHGTQISVLDVNSFQWYANLRHVDLSKNKIKRVDKKTFEHQRFLEELHLSHNYISDFEADMFQGLTNLTVLSLRSNVIESMTSGIFRHLVQLKELDLSHNRLQEMNPETLKGLGQLRVLHLQGNRLSVVPTSALSWVPQLAELNLGLNGIKLIQPGDFTPLQTLLTLDLSGNDLKMGLNGSSFLGLTALRSLKLEDCHLLVVPTEALSRLENLEELYIGRNVFSELPPYAFRDVKRLRLLKLSGCPELSSISKDVLLDNLDIEEVIMTQNHKLSHIAVDAFRFLPNLHLLDLHGNHLRMIDEDAASWSDIREWHLHDNPLVCNCSMLWLQMLLTNVNQSDSKIVRCASPSQLAHVPLGSTKVTDLACGMDATTQGLVIGIVVFLVVIILAAGVVATLCRYRVSCIQRLLKRHKMRAPRHNFERQNFTNDYQGYIMTPNKLVPVTEL